MLYHLRCSNFRHNGSSENQANVCMHAGMSCRVKQRGMGGRERERERYENKNVYRIRMQSNLMSGCNRSCLPSEPCVHVCTSRHVASTQDVNNDNSHHQSIRSQAGMQLNHPKDSACHQSLPMVKSAATSDKQSNKKLHAHSSRGVV